MGHIETARLSQNPALSLKSRGVRVGGSQRRSYTKVNSLSVTLAATGRNAGSRIRCRSRRNGSEVARASSTSVFVPWCARDILISSGPPLLSSSTSSFTFSLHAPLYLFPRYLSSIWPLSFLFITCFSLYLFSSTLSSASAGFTFY